MSRPRLERMIDYSVCAETAEFCVASIADWVARGDHIKWLACLNPHSYAVARKSPVFARALQDADWLIPDGIGIVLASRLRGGIIRQRITGSDIFFGLHARLNASGGARVFFLGSTEDALTAIRRKMALDYPSIEIAGTFSPPFKMQHSQDEIDAMVARINDAAPDVLWVGMTAPKQEVWIHLVRSRLRVKFAAAVGAVFDFYTGRIQRSPYAFQRIGLEWLPRLLQEPRRLWRRMFVSAPIFIWDILRRGSGDCRDARNKTPPQV